jgi:hypothetical protein
MPNHSRPGEGNSAAREYPPPPLPAEPTLASAGITLPLVRLNIAKSRVCFSRCSSRVWPRRVRRERANTATPDYREISARLKDAGHCNERGQPFNPQSVRAMIEEPRCGRCARGARCLRRRPSPAVMQAFLQPASGPGGQADPKITRDSSVSGSRFCRVAQGNCTPRRSQNRA